MPKIVDHDAYRRTIIETAVQLFVTQGYSGLGMRELAGALGISKSALYHYYPSKEALFQDVVDAVVEVTVAELDAHPFAESSFVEKYAFFVDSIQANEERYVQDLLILTEYARLREDNAGAIYTLINIKNVREFAGCKTAEECERVADVIASDIKLAA